MKLNDITINKDNKEIITSALLKLKDSLLKEQFDLEMEYIKNKRIINNKIEEIYSQLDKIHTII